MGQHFLGPGPRRVADMAGRCALQEPPTPNRFPDRPDAGVGLFDIGAIRHDVRKLRGVPVDVLTPKALPETFRAAVFAQVRPP